MPLRASLAELTSLLLLLRGSLDALAPMLARLNVSEVATPRWLTPKEAAARLGVSVRWIQRRRHQLNFVVPMPGGRGWRVSEERLNLYLRR